MREGIIEILSDSDDQVAIEGLATICEYFYLFDKKVLREQFKPRVKEIYKSAVMAELMISSGLSARLAHHLGPIIELLDNQSHLDDELCEIFFKFFSLCLKEQVTFI